MRAKRLEPGGRIGIFCPSHVAEPARYGRITAAIERLGFGVKLGANVQKDTYGYAASPEERAADFNQLVADPSVGLILFSGGQSAVEVLPHIDYENIRRNPKLFSSYSDGTSILNAIYTQTGLITYYGYGAGQFEDLRHYDYSQFCAHFVAGHEAPGFQSDSPWKTICPGSCQGTLLGGYASLFGLLLANQQFHYDPAAQHLLFLEDHESFSNVGAVATYLAFIEQSAFMQTVTGLIFGHYSPNVPADLLRCLERFGQRNGIPVVYTDDFGHGTRHGILPIGTRAKLDADAHILEFYNPEQ